MSNRVKLVAGGVANSNVIAQLSDPGDIYISNHNCLTIYKHQAIGKSDSEPIACLTPNKTPACLICPPSHVNNKPAYRGCCFANTYRKTSQSDLMQIRGSSRQL